MRMQGKNHAGVTMRIHLEKEGPLQDPTKQK